MPREAAEKIGAQMEFGQKYPDQVSVYFIGLTEGSDPQKATPADYFSAEFCGGPHVANTGKIGEGNKRFKIDKQENVGSGIKRIKGVLV
jgi:alanyl-tRNA synthetase